MTLEDHRGWRLARDDRQDRRPLLIVDAANTVGSVPDGWWRDRAGATRRLRDELMALAEVGLSAVVLADEVPESVAGPAEIVLVVEGAARNVTSVAGVRVVAARGSGDDEIVELVRVEGSSRPCLVVTADRELKRRVTALGSAVLGPRTLRRAALSAGTGG